MPLYEYYCTSCDTAFERRRPASEYAQPAVCASGHQSVRRLVSLFAMASSSRSLPSMPAGSGGCACGGGGCGCGH